MCTISVSVCTLDTGIWTLAFSRATILYSHVRNMMMMMMIKIENQENIAVKRTVRTVLFTLYAIMIT